MLEEELPDLGSLLLRPTRGNVESLRRSPRKHRPATTEEDFGRPENALLSATSNQRMLSPSKSSSSKRSPRKAPRSREKKTPPEEVPASNETLHGHRFEVLASAENKWLPTVQRPSPIKLQIWEQHGDSSSDAYATQHDNNSSSEKENARPRDRRKLQVTSAMSRITEAAKKKSTRETPRSLQNNRASRFVLGEARCDDLDESSVEEDEDEETDLSGFIVDDDADLSIYESSSDSAPTNKRSKQISKSVPSRRLVRGRRKEVLDSDDENTSARDTEEDGGLSVALQDMSLGRHVLKSHKDAERRKTIEVVDLTSSPAQQDMESVLPTNIAETKQQQINNLDIFDHFDDALKLEPSLKRQPVLLPSKSGPILTGVGHHTGLDRRESSKATIRPSTPPATPPRSPTKLKSPSKLLSPSKRGDSTARSAHRQSMDAFWDHNVVNEWNDQYSPKKAPTASPRKNLLASFNTWSDSEDDLSGDFNDSSDSLPSPCESPSKSRSRAGSPVKEGRAKEKRLAQERRAKKAQKKDFNARKEGFATDLLQALDHNITNSQISKMAASTGGVQIVWSKTLRSTAGRANWRRTVTKSSGSPVKSTTSSAELSRDSNVVVQHFANIELAEKVIDREERLINTLAHEFCHLANFMVSGVRDQPHGDSFKRWGAKVTNWMRTQTQRPEWQVVEVTTKHGYVIEHKYLWICAGRPQSMAMKMLSIEDDEGCGAEYGRHSKSIDVEKHRCGRCKGMLLQVRPKPRTSPVKSQNRSPFKKAEKVDVSVLEKMIELVELSD